MYKLIDTNQITNPCCVNISHRIKNINLLFFKILSYDFRVDSNALELHNLYILKNSCQLIFKIKIAVKHPDFKIHLTVKSNERRQLFEWNDNLLKMIALWVAIGYC